jgi:hypothetical protein
LAWLLNGVVVLPMLPLTRAAPMLSAQVVFGPLPGSKG